MPNTDDGVHPMRSNAAPVGGRALLGAVLRQVIAIFSISLAVFFSSGTANAAAGSAYIDVPDDRPLNVYVLGDSFAAELADGLKWSLQDPSKIIVHKRTKAATGLVRVDQYDWLRKIRRLVKKEKVDVAVIAIGGNDRQDLRVRGKRYERFSIGWRMEYMKRLEKLATILRKSGAATYWVSLPVVRSKRMTKDYGRFNRYFKSIAKSHGIKFINIRQLFQSKTGGYSAYGRGPRNKTVRLRDKDGIHLTIVGAKKLGNYVARKIRKDLPSNDG